MADFFSTGTARGARDKYEVCLKYQNTQGGVKDKKEGKLVNTFAIPLARSGEGVHCTG